MLSSLSVSWSVSERVQLQQWCCCVHKIQMFTGVTRLWRVGYVPLLCHYADTILCGIKQNVLKFCQKFTLHAPAQNVLLPNSHPRVAFSSFMLSTVKPHYICCHTRLIYCKRCYLHAGEIFANSASRMKLLNYIPVTIQFAYQKAAR